MVSHEQLTNSYGFSGIPTQGIDKNGKGALAAGTIISWGRTIARIRSLTIRAICRIEGGQMWSLTYRELMQTHYGVEIGMHSYGPCLVPGYLPIGTRVGNYCSLAAGLQVFRRNHPVDRLTQHPFFFNGPPQQFHNHAEFWQ